MNFNQKWTLKSGREIALDICDDGDSPTIALWVGEKLIVDVFLDNVKVATECDLMEALSGSRENGSDPGKPMD